MELVRLLRGVILSDHPLQLKQVLFKRIVDGGIAQDLPDDELEAICAFALSLSLDNGDQQRRELLTIVLTRIVEKKAEFFDRYFGHEVIIDLINRAMIPTKSSPSSTSILNDAGDGIPRPFPASDDRTGRGSVGNSSLGSSVAPSPMSTSDPPTPSTMPPSPTNSTSSSQASFGSLCPPSTSQYRNGSVDANGASTSSGHGSVDWTSRLLESVGNAAAAAASTSSSVSDAAFISGPLPDDDPSISASITRQRGICRESAALSPQKLLDVLGVCLRAMSTKISGNNMVRRHKIIAAHMAKLLKAHNSTLDIAVTLAEFQEAHPECTPVGDAADVLCRTLVDVLSAARPTKSQLEIEGVRRYEFNLPKFVQDVGIVTKFLERLWTGNNAESVNEEAKARLITTVMQETFGKLLSPRIPRDIASLLPRPARGEPFLPLAAVLDKIPVDFRERAAHELATDCKNASNEQLQSMLKRMCAWILLLPMTHLTPTIASWVDIIVDKLAAELRYTPLINICESEAGNLWKSAMLGKKKRLVVRESALRILSRFLLGYQHGPNVYFGQISYDFVSSLPELVSDPGSAPLLPAVSKLLYGLLRIHGLPQTFTHNPHVYAALRKLPPVDAIELETYLHRVQWNAKRLPHGWVGLRNRGNTCFANSALQAIRSCAEFTRDVLALEPPPNKITTSHFFSAINNNSATNSASSNNINNSDNKTRLKEIEDARAKVRNNQILIKLQIVLANLVFSQRPIFDPNDFMEVSRPSYFTRGAQQDCVEYLDYLFNALIDKEKADQEPAKGDKSEQQQQQPPPDDKRLQDKESVAEVAEKKPEKVDLTSTTVWRNFGIRMETRHTCHVCGKQTVKEDPYTNIPLPFADGDQQRRQRQHVLELDAKEKEEAARESELQQEQFYQQQEKQVDQQPEREQQQLNKASPSQNHQQQQTTEHFLANLSRNNNENNSVENDGSRPAKVLCGEGNSVQMRSTNKEEEEEGEETFHDALDSPPSSSHSVKSGPSSVSSDTMGPFGDGAPGAVGRSGPIAIGANCNNNGNKRLQRPHTPRSKVYSPMTPASSPSASPPSAATAAFANDVILEEDEEEEEEDSSPLTGKDPYLGASTCEQPSDNDDLGMNNLVSSSSSCYMSVGVPEADATTTALAVEPSANAESGTEFDPFALTAKLEKLQRQGGGDSLSGQRWGAMDVNMVNVDRSDLPTASVDVMDVDMGTYSDPLLMDHEFEIPSPTYPTILPLEKSISATVPTTEGESALPTVGPTPALPTQSASTAIPMPAPAPTTSTSASTLPPPPVPLQPPPLQKPEFYHLANLLKCYLNTEIMHGDNAYHCERCDARQTASRQAFVRETSDYLILSLLRFEFNAGAKRKINNPVVIPQELNVPVHVGADVVVDADPASTRRVDESLVDIANSDQSPSTPFNVVEIPYRLVAIVVHSGSSLDSGHYFTYVRTRAENNSVLAPATSGWVQFNDAFAKEAPEATMEELLKTKWDSSSSGRSSGGKDSAGNTSTTTTTTPPTRNCDTPYVLFYEKVKPASTDSTMIDLRGVAPSLRQGTRDFLTMDNRKWLQEKEDTKGGGGGAMLGTMSTSVAKKDDDRKDGGGGGGGGNGGVGGGGPCGGSGFGSFGNGPRFVC